MTDPALRAKLAKLLRLQQSSNAHEAANAASLLERLCRQHGVSPEDVSADHDPERDTAIYFQVGPTFTRVDYADALLLNAVAAHFNGECVITRRPDGSYFRVFATAGNQLQIELYYDYLREAATKLATAAKRAGGPDTHSRSFCINFRKGFALEIKSRLAAMRAQQQRDGIPETGTPGLVLVNRAAHERFAVAALMRRTCGRLRSSGTRFGTGAAAGREAAAGVGLNRQVTTTRPLALAGR
jgi:hypothetical protein